MLSLSIFTFGNQPIWPHPTPPHPVTRRGVPLEGGGGAFGGGGIPPGQMKLEPASPRSTSVHINPPPPPPRARTCTNPDLRPPDSLRFCAPVLNFFRTQSMFMPLMRACSCVDNPWTPFVLLVVKQAATVLCILAKLEWQTTIEVPTDAQMCLWCAPSPHLLQSVGFPPPPPISLTFPPSGDR